MGGFMGNNEVAYIYLSNYDLCFRQPNGHMDYDWILIDKNIALAISLLNKKGYTTVSCCQGHLPKYKNNKVFSRMFQCFVVFSADIVLPSIPYGFVTIRIGSFTNAIISNIGLQYKTDIGDFYLKTPEMIEGELADRNISLINWAMSLPEYQYNEKEEPMQMVME